MQGTETTIGTGWPRDPAPVTARHASDAPTSGVTVPSFGWTGVAMALHRLQQQPTSSLVTVHVPGHLPLTIDVEAHAYWWDTPLAEFPTDPLELEVVTTPKDPAQEAARAPGHGLDALLWLVGNHSFLGELAWWLQRHDRYRLVRWPDLTALPHTPDQRRMTAMLGYTYLPVAELANAGDADPSEARRLVNAYSLMRLLRSETPDAADTATAQEPAPTPATAPPRRGGPARRLRDLLGL